MTIPNKPLILLDKINGNDNLFCIINGIFHGVRADEIEGFADTMKRFPA